MSGVIKTPSQAEIKKFMGDKSEAEWLEFAKKIAIMDINHYGNKGVFYKLPNEDNIMKTMALELDFFNDTVWGDKNMYFNEETFDNFQEVLDERYLNTHFDYTTAKFKAPRVKKDDKCAICLEKLYNGSPISIISSTPFPTTPVDCGHAFHTECITPLKENRKPCPICRQYIKELLPVYSGPGYNYNIGVNATGKKVVYVNGLPLTSKRKSRRRKSIARRSKSRKTTS